MVDIDNAARFETYVILGEAGSGEIGVTAPRRNWSSPATR